MSINEEKLRAYLDHALSAEEQVQVTKQVAGSPEAQAALARLSQERQNVAAHLAVLAPTAENQPDILQAWQRFQAQNPGQSGPFYQERIGNMFSQTSFKRYQPAIVIVTVVAVIAIALSFAPVRAMAGNLLRVFRVQTVKVIPVDRESVDALRNNPNLKGFVDQVEPQLEVLKNSEPQKVDSLDEAAKLAGFDVVEITALPENAGTASISVSQEKTIQLQMDKTLLEAVFDAAEIEVELPDSLNDEPIIITHPNTVVQEWHREGKETVSFIQMPSPAVDYPNDLDLDALGIAGLQLLGMSKEEATTVGQGIDWATTMILPVLNNSKTVISEVTINGEPGLVFANSADKDGEAAVM